jgi:peptidoglycan/xylan/chitin deacetylase (PgdA/CDA1 family)
MRNQRLLSEGKRIWAHGCSSSTAVAEATLLELGTNEGLELLDVPLGGSWRKTQLSFRESSITDVIMKRRETASFVVCAPFEDRPLPGEVICELPDGSAAVTIDGSSLCFGFNPFMMHLYNLGEGFGEWQERRQRHLLLQIYWHTPPKLRKHMRGLARRLKTLRVKSLESLRLLGVSSNVIVHLIEKHLLENRVLVRYGDKPTAILTHDIDTHFCQTQGMSMVSSVELAEKVKATWFFVPRSVQYCLDDQSIIELTDQGHEVGMHGLTHSGNLALGNPNKLTAQLKRGKQILESIGPSVISFRSPWTLRSPALLSSLASAGFKVDSSYPDVDTLGMTSGQPGVSYNRPYWPHNIENDGSINRLHILEAPIASPQDVQLVEDLGVDGRNLLDVWKYKVEFCKDFGGVFIHHTHPIHLVRSLEYYREFIRFLKHEGFRIMRIGDLCQEYLLDGICSSDGRQSVKRMNDVTQ